jgi:hypothetical protein
MRLWLAFVAISEGVLTALHAAAGHYEAARMATLISVVAVGFLYLKDRP